MFYCKTELSCDICHRTYTTEGNRMDLCSSKDFFRYRLKEKGWKTIYKKYDVCNECITHYGLKECRKMLIKKEQTRSSC